MLLCLYTYVYICIYIYIFSTIFHLCPIIWLYHWKWMLNHAIVVSYLFLHFCTLSWNERCEFIRDTCGVRVVSISKIVKLIKKWTYIKWIKAEYRLVIKKTLIKFICVNYIVNIHADLIHSTCIIYAVIWYMYSVWSVTCKISFWHDIL